MEERISTLEEKISNIQLTLDLLPDTLSKVLFHHQIRLNQENEIDHLQNSKIITSSRSCPPNNPWGQTSCNAYGQNNLGNMFHNKKLSTQSSLETPQGLGVPLVLTSQMRSPPAYTEKKKNFSCLEEEKLFHSCIDKKSPIYQPIGSSLPYTKNADYS